MPLLPYFLAYVGGITLALPPAKTFFFAGFLPVTLVSLSIYCSRKSLKPFRRGTGLVLLFFLGWLAPDWNPVEQSPQYLFNQVEEGKRYDVTGVLLDLPQHFPDKVRYLVELETVELAGRSMPVRGRARISLYEIDSPVGAGDRVRFKKIRLRRPRNLKNPGRFDYAMAMKIQGIDLTGGLSRPERIEKLGSVSLPFWITTKETVRRNMMNTVDRFLSEREGALLRAMVLGEKQFLPDELYSAYRATGLAHLMAVSGLHIGFVAGALFTLLYSPIFYLLYRWRPSWAKSGRTGQIVAGFCLIAVLGYMILVGAKVSALRAGTMVLLFLLSIILSRRSSLLNAMLIAALALLLWNPRSLLSIGFQLSFSAVACILAALHLYKLWLDDPVERMKERSPLVRYFGFTMFISLAASLATFPLILFYFNQISLVGWAMNLFMIPLATVLVPLSLIALTVGLFWKSLAGVLLWPCSLLLKVFVGVPLWVAQWPGVSVHAPAPTQAWMVLYFILLFSIPYWFFRNRLQSRRHEATGDTIWNKPLLIALSVGSVLLVSGFVWPRGIPLKSDKLTITMLDVGQGESIFLDLPDRTTLLVDGGGFYKNSLDLGKAVLAPYIWSRGLRSLDIMTATHSDNDHISGLESLIEFFPVKTLWRRNVDRYDSRLRNLQARARERNIKIDILETGKPVSMGEVTLTALHPGAEFVNMSNAETGFEPGNDHSLVLRVDYREFSMLLTGDIGAPAERYLVDRGAHLKADFLKAPHHGSRSSSTLEFIRAVKPQHVLFSSGYLNAFGHPKPEIVARYRTAGANVWRTDLHGAITIVTNGHEHKIKTHENL